MANPHIVQNSDDLDAIILGGGAVGMLFASIFQRHGIRAKIICRSNLEKLKSHGILVESTGRDAQPLFLECSNKPGATSPRVIILATKTTEPINELKNIIRRIPGTPAIVVAQNGLMPEQWISNMFPDRTLISCVAFCSIVKTSPNSIRFPSKGSIIIGKWPSGSSPLVETLCKAINQPAIPCQISRDMRLVRWQKSMWNSAFNLLSVVHNNLETREFAKHPSIRQDLQTIMEEVRLVAQSAGAFIPIELIQQYINNSLQMPPGRTSMAEDVIAGRPLEIQGIAGDILKESHILDVQTPTLARLVAQIESQFQPLSH